MVSPVLIGGVIAVSAIIGVAVFSIVKYITKKKIEHKREAEKSLELLESEVGLSEAAKAELKVESTEEAVAKQELALKSSERSKELEVKGDKGALRAIQAVEEGARAAEQEEEAEKSTAVLEGKSIGIEAAVKKITSGLIAYTRQKRSNFLTEEQQAIALNEILRKIERLSNTDAVDNRVSSYLREYLGDLVTAFRQDMDTERQKQILLENLINELENGIDVMKIAIIDAKMELKRILKHEKRTRKDFRKELIDYERSLKSKSEQIDELDRTGEAPPKFILSLIKERDMHAQQFENAKTLNHHLVAIYSFIKIEITQMKKLLNYILTNQKEIKGYEKILNHRKNEVIKRFSRLRKPLADIERIAEEFKFSRTHDISLILSNKLKSYFTSYLDILEEDLKFDYVVRQLTTKNFAIAKQMEAFQHLAIQLTQSEAAVQTAVEVLTECIGGIAEKSSQRNIAGIISTLRKSSKILNYEKDIESFMKNLAKLIEGKIKQISSELQDIIEEDKNLIAQIKAEQQSNSSHLGLVIGNVFRRKIQSSSQPTRELAIFARKLHDNNPASGKAFKQVLQDKSVAKISSV